MHSKSDTERVIGIVTGAAMAQALAVAVELGVLDALHYKAKAAPALAAELDCQSDTLLRLLRAMVAVGVCETTGVDQFALTSTGELLCRDTEDSLFDWVVWSVRHLWPLWAALQECVTTGESARTRMLGTAGFEHLVRDPGMAATFARAMGGITARVGKAFAQALDLSQLDQIIDVGGAYGDLLIAILTRYPKLHGTLLERNESIAGARGRLRSANLSDRCEVHEGDFFLAVPAGADGYLLKSVLHDWRDEECETILRNCRQAMKSRARLWIIEQLLPERIRCLPEHQDAVRKDLTMLIGPGGKERTEQEFEKLLRVAGLRIQAVHSLSLHFSALEVVLV